VFPVKLTTPAPPAKLPQVRPAFNWPLLSAPRILMNKPLNSIHEFWRWFEAHRTEIDLLTDPNDLFWTSPSPTQAARQQTLPS